MAEVPADASAGLRSAADDLAGLRCAFCHSGIGADDVGHVCPGCGTRLHDDCAKQLGRCPTLGCARGAVVVPTQASDAKGPVGAAPAPCPTYVLYSANQVLIVSLVFSVFGGALLVGLNAWRLGRRAAGALVVAVGLVVVLTFSLLAELLSARASPAIMSLLLALALRQVAAIAQGRAYAAHLAAGGRRGSTWAASGLAVLALAVAFVPAVRIYDAFNEAIPEAIRARAYGNADDIVTAERLCSLLLLLDPEDGWAYSMRGFVRGKQGRHDEALSDHERAVRLAPADAWTFARRAHTLLERRERAREALVDIDRALQIEPGASWFWSLRGCAHEDLGERGAAREAYENALHADPGDTYARERLDEFDGGVR